ncbi:hypothetical protein M5K25_016288 [Dendrobium thyrsiflorum]|uniref:Uncharacterized protein n=1 Tax=Dendrobium thyrsiflorum TaxID=117978 RepID=A0ABD0UJB3_DENTH
MPRGGLKRRSKFCFASCFSAPSVWDPDELEFQREGVPLSYLSHLRSLSRTVPVEEITGNEGDVHVEVLGGMESENSPAWLSPAANKDKGLVQKFRKDKKNSLPHSPLSVRTHNKDEHQPSIVCHVSTNRSQPLSQLHHARDPVQTMFRTSHPVTSQPNRPAGAAPAPSPTGSARRLDPLIALLMLSATLTVLLSFGRLCAVLCNCAWFYLLSCVPPAPMPPSPAKELSAVEELDVDSPAYKKKVVLMGLLERNRYGFSGMPMTPMASPTTARLNR